MLSVFGWVCVLNLFDCVFSGCFWVDLCNLLVPLLFTFVGCYVMVGFRLWLMVGFRCWNVGLVVVLLVGLGVFS